MQIGEKVTVTIAARRPWNGTGVVLEHGHTYRLTAAGEWVDAWSRCGPAGYPSNNIILRLAERLRRDPQQPWFALIGAHAHDPNTHFAIGTGCVYRPQRSGELSCFANDVPFFYWNNRGSISLTVERVA